MKIRGFDTDKKVLIIAEIGNNHEGNFMRARKLVKEASRCGVDAVKFQTFRTEHYINRSLDTERFNRLKSYELTPEQLRSLQKQAHSAGLLFISTPFDLGSVTVLRPLVDAFKIASGDLPFYPLIAQVLKTRKPIILSTGLSDLGLIQKTLGFIKKHSRNTLKKTALLHCVSCYPPPSEEIMLRAIPLMADRLHRTIGYSDHALGIDAAVAAAALGARIIEKHFTLDNNQSSFRDHAISANPEEMRILVQRIRALELLLGKSTKKIQKCEKRILPLLRRSIVAARNLSAGEIVRLEHLAWTRPAGGLAPGEEKRLMGKRLKHAISSGHRFRVSDVH